VILRDREETPPARDYDIDVAIVAAEHVGIRNAPNLLSSAGVAALDTAVWRRFS
jgi:hypothetical protein